MYEAPSSKTMAKDYIEDVVLKIYIFVTNIIFHIPFEVLCDIALFVVLL